MEQSPDGSLWEDARKRRYRRSSLPFLPAMEVQDFPPAEGGYIQTVYRGKPENLKPYGNAEKVLFSLSQKKIKGGSLKRFWRCEYLGDSVKKVLGEKRDIQSFECQRFTEHKKTAALILRETRTISYSVELGLNVRQTVVTAKGEKKSKLIALFSEKKATAAKIAKLVAKTRK
ncbi:MAG: hypothetical protein V7739_11360 [Motiliproteus sp.]